MWTEIRNCANNCQANKNLRLNDDKSICSHTHINSTKYLHNIKVCRAGLACEVVLFLEQLSQTDVEGSTDMADGEAVLRPLSASLHVTNHCKNQIHDTSEDEVGLVFNLYGLKQNIFAY